MNQKIRIQTSNFSGQDAQLLFKPDNDNVVINLGIVTLPYTFESELLNPPREVYGTYTILITGSDCPNILNVPRPVPTPTPTPIVASFYIITESGDVITSEIGDKIIY